MPDPLRESAVAVKLEAICDLDLADLESIEPPLGYDGLLRAGVGWPVIQSATGIDEQTYRALKRDSANGTEPDAPRQ